MALIIDQALYIYDSIGPILTPLLPANSKVVGNTPLFFTANEDIQSDVTWNASGCTFGTTAITGQTFSATLLNCTSEGTVELNITTLDTVGNVASHIVSYVYDVTGPVLTPSLAANRTVTANTRLSFTANEEVVSVQFDASGCTWNPLEVTGQTITVDLMSCAEGGFSVSITALDSVGNVGSFAIQYHYDSVVPTLVPSLAADSAIAANTSLSFTTNKAIPLDRVQFAAPGCVLTTPSVVGQTVSATLVSCSSEDILLAVTVTDMAEREARSEMRYVYTPTAGDANTSSNLTTTEASTISGVAIAAIVLACIALAAIIVALILFLLPSTRAYFSR